MSSATHRQPLFKHGGLVLSPAVAELARLGRIDVIDYFNRHLRGDWGTATLVRGIANEQALRGIGPLMSVFMIDVNKQLLAITSENRSVTTLLLAGEEENFKAELPK
mgnify:CR=1 FL=1